MTEEGTPQTPAHPTVWITKTIQRAIQFVHQRPRTGIMPPADITGATLILVVAAMGFLACLALGAMITVTRSASDWTTQLEGALTIQVKPQNDIAMEDQISAALSVLDGTPGIARASALSDADVRALLDPWLGESRDSEDLPLPSLIDVELDPGAIIDMGKLAERLAAAAPGIELDTHRQWLGELLSAARSAVWLSIGILALIAVTTGAIVVFATQASLAANHETVEVLHLVGAQDEFVASEVQRHFFQLGLRGGASGLAAAIITFVLISWLGSEGGAFLLPVPGLSLGDYPWLLTVPAAIALTTTAAARITVLRVLRQMI